MDANVVWRYADFVLDRDSNEGVRVFTETHATLDPSRVLHTLQRYPEARLGFLHHLIDTKKLKVSCLVGIVCLFYELIREVVYKVGILFFVSAL